MDVFKEFIVKKELSSSEKLTRTFVIIACISLAFAFLAFTFNTILQLFGFLLAAASVYFGWKIVTRYFVEYEYIITNADLDIDKITNQSSRKRLCTVNLHTLTEIGRVKENFSVGENETLIRASACSEQLDDYYLRFKHKEYGESVLVFTPSVEFADLIKPFIPRNAKNYL